MKKKITIVFLLLAVNSYSQSVDNSTPNISNDYKSDISLFSEINLFYNFGFSNQNFKIPENNLKERYDHRNARSYYDQGLMLRYQFNILHKKKNRLSVGTGIGYSNSKHYHSFTESKYEQLLETVIFDSKTLSIPFVMGYERELINEKLFLELSYCLNYNIPTQENSTYTNIVEKKYNFIDYSYTLNVSTKTGFSNWISLTSKLQLINNLFLNSSLSFLTSKRIEYNYESNYVYHLTQNGNNYIESVSYTSLPSIELKDKYIYLSIGLGYRF